MAEKMVSGKARNRRQDDSSKKLSEHSSDKKGKAPLNKKFNSVKSSEKSANLLAKVDVLELTESKLLTALNSINNTPIDFGSQSQ